MSLITTSLETFIHRVPHFKGKTRLCVLAAKLIEGRSIRTAYGPLLECHLGDMTNKSAVFGWYGDVVHDAIIQLAEGDIFVDIGANSGLFSILAGQCVGRRGRVYAFEPQHDMFHTLKNNLRINDLVNVTAVNAAVTQKSGTVEMTMVDPNHTGITRIDLDVIGNTRAINLDDDMPEMSRLVDGQNLMIKIDVEGAEGHALKAITSLLKVAKILIVEINEKNLAKFDTTAKDIYEFVGDYGLIATRKIKSQHFDEVFERRPSPAQHDA